MAGLDAVAMRHVAAPLTGGEATEDHGSDGSDDDKHWRCSSVGAVA